MISNKSKTYLLPLLSEMVDLNEKYFKFIQNTYTIIEGHENCLAVLHDFSFRNPDFTAYEHKLIKNELFVELIDIDDKVLYIFKFPEVYMHEYNCFKEGKYSQFGTDAKELVLEFYNNIYKGNINATTFLLKVNQILFKDKKLKRQIEEELNVSLSDEAELSGIAEEAQETFDILKYTKIQK